MEISLTRFMQAIQKHIQLDLTVKAWSGGHTELSVSLYVDFHPTTYLSAGTKSQLSEWEGWKRQVDGIVEGELNKVYVGQALGWWR